MIYYNDKRAKGQKDKKTKGRNVEMSKSLGLRVIYGHLPSLNPSKTATRPALHKHFGQIQTAPGLSLISCNP